MNPAMTFDRRDLSKLVWPLLLIAMGVLLCVTTPYAIRESPDSPFLNFARYFIALMLIVGGVKRLYQFYLSRQKEPPSEE
jgi:hypothetical protein